MLLMMIPSLLTGCGLLGGGDIIKTTTTRPDGSVIVTEAPAPDPEEVGYQKASEDVLKAELQ